MQVQSYLFFSGRCEEAINYYRDAIGARLEVLMRFRDCPDPLDPAMVPPGMEDKVMHAAFWVGDTQLLASDGCPGQQAAGPGFSLALTVADEAEADRIFNALADGGQVQMPLAKTFFSPRFGTLSDRFGIGWMVLVGA